MCCTSASHAEKTSPAKSNVFLRNRRPGRFFFSERILAAPSELAGVLGRATGRPPNNHLRRSRRNRTRNCRHRSRMGATAFPPPSPAASNGASAHSSAGDLFWAACCLQRFSSRRRFTLSAAAFFRSASLSYFLLRPRPPRCLLSGTLPFALHIDAISAVCSAIAHCARFCSSSFSFNPASAAYADARLANRLHSSRSLAPAYLR